MKHPGVLVGDQCCQGSDAMVPKSMGWMWNVGVSERGWRPGAVRNSVAKIMKLYLTAPKKPKKLREKTDPPTLRVQKKNGKFTIVMNPLRDDKKPNEKSSPIIFQLEKSEESKKRSMARKALKDRGVIQSCDCSTLKKCNCMNECEKARIKFELLSVSKAFCIEPELSLCDMKDSSDSEIEFEFTPPSAAKLRSSCFMPMKVSVAATQCETQVVDDKCEEDEIIECSEKKGKTVDNKICKKTETKGKKDSKIAGNKSGKKDEKNGRKTAKLQSDESEITIK